MATKPSTEADVESNACSDLSAFQTDILAVIADEGRPYGLAIKDNLEDVRYEKVNHGRLYPNLDTLVEKGLVEKGEIDNRTNYYTLTGEGVTELNDYQSWLAGCLEGDADE